MGREASRSELRCWGKRLRRRSLVCEVGGRKAGLLRDLYTEEGEATEAAEERRAAVRAGQLAGKSVAAGRVCSQGWEVQRSRAAPRES